MYCDIYPDVCGLISAEYIPREHLFKTFGNKKEDAQYSVDIQRTDEDGDPYTMTFRRVHLGCVGCGYTHLMWAADGWHKIVAKCSCGQAFSVCNDCVVWV